MSSVPDMLARLAPWPEADFAEFGEVETRPLSRYQKLTAGFLGRNWALIPHVTHHDDLDISDCEARRIAWNASNPDRKLTPVVLVAKALALTLGDFPQFNASLGADGKTIVMKHYCNIGIAVETPQGLLVPVLRGCDVMTLTGIATQLSALAGKARTKGLSLAEMSGSSITISSLGHIGGTGFTPIVNAPDVAIVGLTKARDVPVKGADGGIMWRLMLPVSLSYDHRVIDGADAARFVRCIGERLNTLIEFN